MFLRQRTRNRYPARFSRLTRKSPSFRERKDWGFFVYYEVDDEDELLTEEVELDELLTEDVELEDEDWLDEL